MKKDHAQNTVGPWAEKKLDALERHLKAYLIALKNQRFTKVYIDAFAGSCVSKIRAREKSIEGYPLLETVEDAEAQDQFILGSPLRALGAGDGFARYYFFDLDESRAEALNSLSHLHPNRKIDVQVGDSNKLIANLTKFLSNPNVRGVAFLDPYGPHLEWSTLKALASTGNMEVIINFPAAMAINRLLVRSGDVPENWARLLTNCFGDEAWKQVAYSQTEDMFGDLVTSKNEDVSTKLLEFYVGRLSGLFKHVAKPALIQNTRGAPLYYLIWAGPHKNGQKIANHILSMGDKVKLTKP